MTMQRMVYLLLWRAWIAAGLILAGCAYAWWLWLGEGQPLTAAAVVLLLLKYAAPMAPSREEIDAVVQYWEGTS